MGGGHYPYPKWVWSPLGGSWPRPRHEIRNAFITATFIFSIAALAARFSANNERRHMYPTMWIPSMLWARDFHDPAFVAMWKEGREWIEPIPDWWPFKGKK